MFESVGSGQQPSAEAVQLLCAEAASSANENSANAEEWWREFNPEQIDFSHATNVLPARIDRCHGNCVNRQHLQRLPSGRTQPDRGVTIPLKQEELRPGDLAITTIAAVEHTPIRTYS